MLKKFKLNAESWVLKHKQRISSNITENIRGLTMCKKCYTFYYKNSWHFERPLYLEQLRDEEVSVRFIECPACMEEEVAFYEAESNLVLGRR